MYLLYPVSVYIYMCVCVFVCSCLEYFDLEMIKRCSLLALHTVQYYHLIISNKSRDGIKTHERDSDKSKWGRSCVCVFFFFEDRSCVSYLFI